MNKYNKGDVFRFKNDDSENPTDQRMTLLGMFEDDGKLILELLMCDEAGFFPESNVEKVESTDTQKLLNILVGIASTMTRNNDKIETLCEAIIPKCPECGEHGHLYENEDDEEVDESENN